MSTKGGIEAELKPILVVLAWRGGERFKRALASIRDNERHFSRVILSITSEAESVDVRIAEKYISDLAAVGIDSKAEIICTGQELPTMKHQAFWIEYLQSTGATPEDWVFWLAYDDQLRRKGIEEIVQEGGAWNLSPRTIYLGPWSIRHETSLELWSGCAEEEEIWTCLPNHGSRQIPVLEWISNQIIQPTYIQMSGSVAQLECHSDLVHNWPKKRGPMRIEMATAAHFNVRTVTEFVSAPTYIYGRSDSDRSAYGRRAYLEDLNLALKILGNAHKSRRSFRPLMRAVRVRLIQICTRRAPAEEWRVRA